MADENRYAHITVTPDDDDDVVIHAGTPARSAAAPAAAPAAPQAQPAPAPAPEAVAASEPADAPHAQAKPAADSSYRETTLEDITGSKMPTMQKVIIVLALVAIAAFVAWCVFL